MDIDPVKSQAKSPAEKSLEIAIGDVDIIDVDVDDQAKTTTLGALTASAAAAVLANKEKNDANGTQEIDFGDVLEVMQKPAQAAPASTRSVPRPTASAPPSARVAPPSDQVVHGVVVPPPPSAPQMVLPSVMVRNTPVPAAPADATQELGAVDVLEEVVVAPAPAQAAAPQAAIPVAPITAPLPYAPPAPVSNSDIAKTHVLPPTPRAQLAQYPVNENPLARFSIDEEVAPFASDTVDIPLNRVAGMPVWLQIKDKPQLMVVGGAIAACVAIGALALGIHLHSAASDSSAQTANANAATGPSMHKEDPAAAIPPPPAQPDVQTVSVDDLKRAPSHAAPAADAPAEAVHVQAAASHHSHAASHHTDAAPAPKSHVQKPQGFGLVRTWIAARGEPISVDGKAMGVAPSPVRVSCGPHTIAIGHEVVKADVPCDGAITVGSPDHKK